ncbi:MAG TPA: SUMF1/EgtB/PvdO family nonheme iron enzyme [Anaerolineae bacterium]|nr:SUMF1/EgtB/PvdO family nonheme iron enzyme [Anaerolineae bacterium]
MRIYRRVLINQSRHLPLRGVDVGASDPAGGQNQLGLAQVYVDLDTRQSEKWGYGPMGEILAKPVTALAAAAKNRQLVLLGDPGGGKSTFVNHLAHCLAAHQLQPEAGWEQRIPAWPEAETNLLPIMVILRDFAQSLPERLPKVASPNDLWQFIEQQLDAQNLEFAAEAMRAELDGGRCLLLLDGLDEVAKRDQRAFVRDVVMAFVGRYGENRYVVTCRTLSYQDVAWRLPTPTFPTFELAPFSEAKIDAFIVAWYQELMREGQIREQDRAGLTQQLQGAVRRPDLWSLAANPLLLTVMALVHAHKGRLPEARALLYEETIEMLLWRWEQGKGGQGEVPRLRQLLLQANLMEMDLKKVLWGLAYQAHGQQETAGTGGSDIGEWALTKRLAELCEGEDLNWGRDMVQAMKLRAGLLVERAPGVFAFPHRTFQEYLAGAYLSTQKNFARVATELASPLWREVILLAVGRLVYLTGDMDRPLGLVGRLCPERVVDEEGGWYRAWLAGEVLVEMGLGRVGGDSWGEEMLGRVRERLTMIVAQGKLSARQRAEAGMTLAKLGDRRSGVGIRVVAGETLPDIELCYVPAGEFWLGSDEGDDDEKPAHLLDIPYGYWLGKYPVTVGQYDCFVRAGGYQEADYWGEAIEHGRWRDGQIKGWNGWNGWRSQPEQYREPFHTPNHPVIGVNWYEAMAFCRWLGGKVSLPTGYRLTLPSEAEWEKGAKGGVELPREPVMMNLLSANMAGVTVDLVSNQEMKRRYPWGNEIGAEGANYDETGIDTTCVVGMFPSNVSPYGLVDMAGNVFDWTRTVWGYDYPYRAEDGREKLASADGRVLRGGSWRWNDDALRCAYRLRYHFNVDYLNYGFRVMVCP